MIKQNITLYTLLEVYDYFTKNYPMNLRIISIKLVLLLMVVTNLNSCGIYRPVSAKDYPPEPEKRIQKNRQDGKGFQIWGGNKKGGEVDCATSNEMG